MDARPDFSNETDVSIDFLDHIDHWLEYLTELLDKADRETKPKWERQIRYLLCFRAGVNCNISHNFLLQYYYRNQDTRNGDGKTPFSCKASTPKKRTVSHRDTAVEAFIAEFEDRLGLPSMAIHAADPIQGIYQLDDPAFQLICKSLASEDLFFIQGPPGTGKTTAIVEIILQQMKADSSARILISSETHVAVDNALDRLANEASPELLNAVLRYPGFSIVEFECQNTPQSEAISRADVLWREALKDAPELTRQLGNDLHQFARQGDGGQRIPRWQARNLADMHQIIGVTCNQIDHLMDSEAQMFDLAIVDECSKATMPEWLMAMSVARKCILVGDHKQLPPTFCTEEVEVLDQMDEHKERLIRNGVIESLFENLPADMKGTLGKQFRMVPAIGQFISEHFYNGELEHHRTESDLEFQDFGWLTYKSDGLRVPEQQGKGRKVLRNYVEINIIMARLTEISDHLKQSGTERKISVALITPYRAQRNALREELNKYEFSDALAVEVDTVDAFQGRQASIVFFSFVRTIGPPRFYADDRRMNVAISRARDVVYLVGDKDYIASRRLPVLDALTKLSTLKFYDPHDFAPPVPQLQNLTAFDGSSDNT